MKTSIALIDVIFIEFSGFFVMNGVTLDVKKFRCMIENLDV